MSERLTKEEWYRRCQNWVPELHVSGELMGLVEVQWNAIKEHVETVCEEARAEVLKDRYSIGEKAELMSDFWEPVTFGFVDKHGAIITDISNGSFHFRRVPTRQSKIAAILHHFKTEREFDWDKITDDQLDGMISIGRIEVQP